MSDDVKQWLEQIGLGQYADAFVDNDIGWALLPRLDNEILKDIGVKSAGHRMQLVEAAAALNTDSLEPAPLDSGAGPAPFISQAERRQLTVMFCDLVGSTDLSGKLDPEDLRDVVRAYQETADSVIQRFDGHVAQHLGDGLLVYFGYPVAHEDDAQRAVHAGLGIIEAMAVLNKGLEVDRDVTLRLRIGIHTGPVVVGEMGHRHHENLAVGETPNVAARLQGLAQADQIIISPDTRRLIGATFELDDCGEQALKGVVEPVRAWRVTALAATKGRFDAAHRDALSPLVGRELELGLLMDRWQLAQDGEGQVVLVGGEPGIGKSRLLSALREAVENKGAKPMRIQCSPYYVNSAFWPSIENFGRALKFGRDETSEARLDKLESLIVGHYERPLTDVRFIASMLSIACDERYGALSVTPQKFKDETLRTLVDLTEAAAKKQPSLLLYEDAHWADPSSLEVLDLLIDRVKTMPLLIVITHRLEFENRWVDHGHVTALNLSKLTDEQSSALVLQVVGGKTLPEDLLEQILVETDGVPLYVEELTQSILESGELIDQGDRYEYAGTSHQVTIPATLRGSLMARLDRYVPVKAIAQIGAAIGREFSHEMISSIAPMPTEQLDDALILLTESGLAFRRGTPPNAVYTFKHALVQDAAYDSLLRSGRRELHGKIAKVIEARFPAICENEPEVMARHLTAAGATEAAIPLWQQAGALALTRMALAEAISHLSQGLELIETLPASSDRDARELDLRVPLGTAWLALKGWQAAEVWNCLNPALGLAKKAKRNDVLPFILYGLRNNIMVSGRVAESLPRVEEMLQTANVTGDSVLLVLAHVSAASVYSWMGRLSESLAHCNKVLALYDNEKHGHLINMLNQDPKTFASLVAARKTWMQGYPDRAVRLFDMAVAHSRRMGHPFDLALALSWGADLFDFRGEAQAYRRHLEEAERLSRDNSLQVLWEMLIQVRYGLVCIQEGNPTEGIQLIKAGLAPWDAVGGKLDVPRNNSRIAEGMAQSGDIDSALQRIDESIEQVERPGWEEREYYAEILRLKGWMLTLKDDPAGAEKNYLASLDCARKQQAKSWELRAAVSLARLWQAQGKDHEAFELLKPVYDWFTEGFDTQDLKEAKTLLDELN